MATGGTSKKGDKCLDCGENVSKKDQAVACDICLRWCHIKCCGIDPAAYETIKTVKSLHWYCDSCDTKMLKLIEDVVKLEKRQEILESQIKEVQMQLDCLKQNKVTEEQVKAVKSELQQSMKEMAGKFDDAMNCVKLEINENKLKLDVEQLTKAFVNDGSWCDIVKKEVNKQVEGVTGELDGIHKTINDTKIQVENEKEKEMKRKNVIIFKVPENPNCVSLADQLLEDRVFVCELFSYIYRDNFQSSEIKRVLRLGRRSYNVFQEAVPCRPLLVEFAELSAKNFVMNNLSMLRNSEDKFKRLIINHDMTALERDQCRKLVSEAKEMEASDTSGEWIYRVRGIPGKMLIVKWRKR